ncbi:45166_t:CDS:1, partial [Gigaspora margarita]
ATTENWKEYKSLLQYFLSKYTFSLDMLNKDINKISQKDIDNIWVSIETGILYAAKQNILFRKISNSTKKALSTNKKRKSLLQKDTISISKVCQELKKLARENKDQKAISALSSKRALKIRLL